MSFASQSLLFALSVVCVMTACREVPEHLRQRGDSGTVDLFEDEPPDSDDSQKASVVDIQRGDVAPGSEVQLSRLVLTARSRNGREAWVQDVTVDAGPFNGILLYNGREPFSDNIQPGVLLSVRGKVKEFTLGEQEGSVTQLIDLHVDLLGGEDAPKPKVVEPASLAEAIQERWEGVLVLLAGLQVVGLPAVNVEGDKEGQVLLRSDETTLRVDENVFEIVGGEGALNPSVGQVVDVTGVMHYNPFKGAETVTLVAIDIFPRP